MAIGLLGNKMGMTQIFDKTGNVIPVTILKVGPCIITQIKTKAKDGYDSIQIGYGSVSNKSLTQPKLGHLQKSNFTSLNKVVLYTCCLACSTSLFNDEIIMESPFLNCISRRMI